METQLKSTNIIIVYLDIKYEFIDSNVLRSLMGPQKEFGSNLLEQANFKQLVLPQSKKIIAITPDRKVVVEDASGEKPERSKLITEYLDTALKAVGPAATQPVAYGFNYSIVVNDVENGPNKQRVLETFNLAESLKNFKTKGVGLRITYEPQDEDTLDYKKRFDLRLESNPLKESQYIVNFNAHYYELSKGMLPVNNLLSKQYNKDWKHLVDLTSSLFKKNE